MVHISLSDVVLNFVNGSETAGHYGFCSASHFPEFPLTVHSLLRQCSSRSHSSPAQPFPSRHSPLAQMLDSHSTSQSHSSPGSRDTEKGSTQLLSSSSIVNLAPRIFMSQLSPKTVHWLVRAHTRRPDVADHSKLPGQEKSSSSSPHAAIRKLT